jgi:predicted PurR-regulated permease PerM
LRIWPVRFRRWSSGARSASRTLGELVQALVSGLLAGLGSVTVLIVGVVTGLFILLFLMKDWRLVTDGTANQLAALLGLPDRVGRQIVADTVHSFRGYALGLTIVGLMNGAVVGLGALLLGVPLAGPIAIVTFATSYIPFFGAFFAGAFAVLIALGAKGSVSPWPCWRSPCWPTTPSRTCWSRWPSAAPCACTP